MAASRIRDHKRISWRQRTRRIDGMAGRCCAAAVGDMLRYIVYALLSIKAYSTGTPAKWCHILRIGPASCRATSTEELTSPGGSGSLPDRGLCCWVSPVSRLPAEASTRLGGGLTLPI